MNIYSHLKDPAFRFCLIRRGEKGPFEKDWPNGLSFDDRKLTNHLKAGGNYGVIAGWGGLAFVDVDLMDSEFLAAIESLGRTFTIRTGSGKRHYYFKASGVSNRGFEKDGKHYGELRAVNQQVVGPGSLHPSGGIYEVLVDAPIREVQAGALVAALVAWLKTETAGRAGATRTEALREETDEMCAEIKRRVRLSELMAHYKMDTSRNPGKCPWHKCADPCFSWDDSTGLWHCFDTDCLRSGNIFHLVMQMENCDFLTAKSKMADLGGVTKKRTNTKTKDNKKDPLPTSFLELNGKLAEMVWDGARSRFAVYDPNTAMVILSDEFGGKVPYNDDMVLKGVVLFPSGADEYESDEKLIEDIRVFIHKYMDVSEFYEKLVTYYVILTWLYDNFNTLPYLRVIGDYGSGKSRLLQTIGHLCYKPMFVGGATTPSPVFRIMEMFHGTLIYDEADFKLSDEQAEIIKILNCGFQTGFPVLRTEEDDGKRSPKSYDCYGPKILATRNEFKDKALESRCLTEKLTETSRMDIPLLLDEDFFRDSRKIRNKLLMFRFRHYGKYKIDLSQQDITIERRLNQVVLPLYSVITDYKIREDLKEFMRLYNKRIIADRGEQFEALVLEKIVEILELREKDGLITDQLYVKTVVDAINVNIKKEEDKFTPHRVGNLIRKKLFLELKKDREGRWIRWNVPMFFKLIKKFGVGDDATFVTLYMKASDDSHTAAEKSLCDYATCLHKESHASHIITENTLS